jgi:multidrug efflux system membrane fusion protein
MAGFFRAHRVAAIVVLIAAGAWIATGEFAAVGSEEAHAASDVPAPEAVPAPVLRTVAAVTPVFVDHAREIRLSGATEADKRAVLAARSSGVVGALGVQEGEVVKAETIVLALEGADVTAEVATAEASLAQRTRELEVAQALYDRGSGSELSVTNARAATAAAEARLRQAIEAVDRLNLRAPFTGIVDRVDVELGEWVQQGTPIATVLALDPIVIRAEVSEIDVGSVAVGARARVRLVNGAEMDGSVRQIANEATALTRTFAIEIGLPNPGRAIPAGMTANVTLFASPVSAVTVPRSVITLSESGLIGLRVVGADNIARFQEITVIDDTAEGLIVTGVPADVRIITAGQDLVRDGDEVIVAEAAAEAGAAAP